MWLYHCIERNKIKKHQICHKTLNSLNNSTLMSSLLHTGKKCTHKEGSTEEENKTAQLHQRYGQNKKIISFYWFTILFPILCDRNHFGQSLGLTGSMYNLHRLHIIVLPRAHTQHHAFRSCCRLSKYNEQNKMAASTLEVPLEFWPCISRFMSLLTTELFQ